MVAHYDPIAGFLDWVADKEEWSVKAFVEPRGVQRMGHFVRPRLDRRAAASASVARHTLLPRETPEGRGPTAGDPFGPRSGRGDP